jgi:hypothetical protein
MIAGSALSMHHKPHQIEESDAPEKRTVFLYQTVLRHFDALWLRSQ